VKSGEHVLFMTRNSVVVWPPDVAVAYLILASSDSAAVLPTVAAQLSEPGVRQLPTLGIANSDKVLLRNTTNDQPEAAA
jgi:hypothetical protein